MIQRLLENKIVNLIGKGKIIHIPGPRQVGKTTLLKKIAAETDLRLLWLNGDEADVREIFTNPTSTRLKGTIGNNRLIIIDEAQRIQDIGLALKLLVDNFPEIQVIASGSSAFELAEKINEPLTGRKTEMFLYPLSFEEMTLHNSLMEEKRMLEHRMIFGYYPEVVTSPSEEKDVLKRLTDAFLYKDVLSYEKLKKTSLIEKLLQALALQLGNQVSFHELGQLLGVDNQTIERYIHILEKAYILFSLPSFSRNLRNELKKSKKIYFYDNGIRNALIRNFNPLSLRQDTGVLWENFLLSERMKYADYHGKWMNRYFWRNHSQQEIDYIEEYDGQLYAYEFKWNEKKKTSMPRSFAEAYPRSEYQVVSKSNYDEFVNGADDK